MPTTSPFCGDRGRPVSLLSFPVFFRCKRYSDSVGAGADLIDGEQLCDLLKEYGEVPGRGGGGAVGGVGQQERARNLSPAMARHLLRQWL